VFSRRDLNITAQYLETDGELGYVVMDIAGDTEPDAILNDLRALEGTVRARFLYDRS
jgi:D-3-phosphoglycerate dehydrogenase